MNKTHADRETNNNDSTNYHIRQLDKTCDDKGQIKRLPILHKKDNAYRLKDNINKPDTTLTTSNYKPLRCAKPIVLRSYRTKYQNQLKWTIFPQQEAQDSSQVTIHIYPSGHAMIPSSEIMSSQGDRRDSNHGAK